MPRADEGEAAARLLVLRHQRDEALDVPVALRRARRQADGGGVAAHARGVGRRAEAELDGEVEGEAHAKADRLAVQQRVAVARGGLEGVGECMAEVEQGALPGLALVGADDARLGAAALRHRAGLRGRVAREQPRGVLLAPREEAGVAEQPVLGHLGVAREQLAAGQRGQRVEVAEHQARLVEGADEVLALARIDRGLAADGAVDLREQRRGRLDEVDAAQQKARGEAGDVADHAAAQRDDQRAAFRAQVEQAVEQAAELVPVLGRLARRQLDAMGGDARGGEAGFQARGVQARDRRVGDDEDAALGQERRAELARALEKAAADMDVVGPRAEVDAQELGVAHAWALRWRAASAAMTRSTVLSAGESSLSTTRSASA